MQGRKNKVTGKRGFDADMGGFLVTHLTNHNNIRVGTQKCPHGRGKIESYFGFHLYLAQTPLGNFNRVFGSPYFCVRLVNMTKGRMKGCCFAASCRPAKKDQSMPVFDNIINIRVQI